ncbi:MAG: sigma-70 family RNA polymerase sigma factor [Thermoleophilia bacterium]|nr:sigma-70 family RNA polymerase sigma factor [Thermoleophilia bacterium]
MEASALTRAPARGLLARRSPLLRLESDERLVELIRAGHDGAFEALFNRYNGRLLGFCQSMLKSRQDAEDVLQEVFTNAHTAMLGDDRKINVRPWLYRIARNRCLNHLRRPVPEGQDSMDVLPHGNGTTTAEHVQMREDLRQLLADVETLPETQRTALLLREIDQLSYEEIAQAMQTTIPSVKSLLVRARIGLAESGQARLLTCDEVQIGLAEAAEGIGKLDGPARKHVRNCDGCRAFREQLRSDRKAMAALFPVGLVALFKQGLLAKLFGSGSAAGAGAGSGAAGAASASGGLGLLGGAVGAKAAAGFATAAILTAGAVEVRNIGAGERDGGSPDPAPAAVVAPEPAFHPKLAAEVVPPLRVTTSEPVAPARPGERERVAPPAEPTEAEPGSAGAPAGPPTTEDATTTPDEGEVAVGTPVAPTGDGGDGQDTGAAPVDPPAPPTEPTEPTEPTVPTVPTGPVTPPTTPEPPTTPAPVAPATSGPPVVSGA